ncbi:prolyl oligopeptidase family serine peptidase [Dokdonella koreensis]
MLSQRLLLSIGLLLSTSLMAQAPAPAPSQDGDDPYLWLEDVGGDKALDWVKARNAESTAALADSKAFEQTRERILEVLDSDARIPGVVKMGAYYYNFWRDKTHQRGLWRRTTLDEYRKDSPAWETILDLDALGKKENENWVWHGAECLRPYDGRCLLSLSRGGADATVVREFDLKTRDFVADGFRLAEAKSSVNWIDIDTLFVGTDTGAGSMTRSGYPRIAKRWKRSTPIESATVVYEGTADDLSINAYHDDTPGFERDFVRRTIDFYSSQTFVIGKDGKQARLPIPDDANGSVHREWLTVETRMPWTVDGKTYPGGALLAAKFDDFMAGKRELVVLFEPTETTSLAGYSWTRHHLIVNQLDDVKSVLTVLTPADGAWKRSTLPGAPKLSTVSATAIDADDSDDYFMTVAGYLEPTTLYRGVIGEAKAEVLKRTPAFFDASRLDVAQHFVKSKDGTRIPYFIVAPRDLRKNGANPTLLYGYGGFEVSLQPGYAAVAGRAWLEKGGVYVVANIRGGGEYGPRWHQAALKQNRLRAYEDFAAVAEDLIARKITSPAHLGIQGGSNGGLLMGNMTVLYPKLFGAVVCQVPLLDMKRYSHLLAGASWMAEYGDPDKAEEWQYIRTFSPYQNVRKDVKYPPVLFTTSTRDDRVHPGHARKMMARMREQGHDVTYYENIEGGHGGAADNRQAAFMQALAYTFLWQHLK